MSVLAIDLFTRHLDEVSYYIDCAEEARHICPDTAMWLRYFCPDVAQRIGYNQLRNTTPDDDFVVEPDHFEGFVVEPDHFEGLRITGMRLDHEYMDWLRAVHTRKDEKLVCTVSALKRIPNLVTETAHAIADRAVHEELDFYPRIEPLTERVKYYGARKTKTSANGTISIHNWFPLLERDPHVASSLTTITNVINHTRLVNEPFPTEIAATMRSRRSSAQTRRNRHAIRGERKVLRLGMEELTELVGYDALRAFLTGGLPLVIPGQRVTFQLRAQRIGGSYGGSSVEVHVGGERVCNLCIHSHDTPILDHVASMVRHIQLGLEDEILEAGNPLNVAVTGPVGIDVLDRKLERYIDSPRRQRVVVRRAPRDDLEQLVEALTHDDDERVVFIGPSGRTRKYQAKIARRASSYIYKTYLPDFKTPVTKFREIYEVHSIRPPRILDIDLDVCDTPEAVEAYAD